MLLHVPIDGRVNWRRSGGDGVNWRRSGGDGVNWGEVVMVLIGEKWC